MAGTRVAAGFGEQRNDVGAQSGRSHPRCAIDPEVDIGVPISQANHERPVAVGSGRDEPVRSHCGDRIRLDAEMAKAGDVADGPVGLAKSHDELLLGDLTDQTHACRLDFEARSASVARAG